MTATVVEGNSIFVGMELSLRATNRGDAGDDIADARDKSAMMPPALKIGFEFEEGKREGRTSLIDVDVE